MEASAFLAKTKTEQVIMVIQQGEEILSRVQKGFHIHLYILENLLVELWYAANTAKIVKTKLSNREQVIEDYPTLDQQVEHLLSNKG